MAKARQSGDKATADKQERARQSQEEAVRGLTEALSQSGASPEDLAELTENMQRAFERMQKLWAASLTAPPKDPTLVANPDPFNTWPAFGALWQGVMTHPGEFAEATLKFWTDQSEIWRRATMKAAGAEVEPVIEAPIGDKRFKDPEWSRHSVFDALKQSYLLTATYLTDTAHKAGEMSAFDRRKVEFFTRQFVEAISPSNFLATNPEVLRVTLKEKGRNLVRGFDNLIADLERGGGSLKVRQTDLDKFKVGENLAITPGVVIHRNEVMELIQYAPTTKKVGRRPLLICPPWINKFYILDLNPQKSMVRWLVDQGFTVFMISWVNPDERYGDKMFADYIAEGLFEAAAHVLDETGADDLHLASYCIGGTMTGAALAYLAQQPEHPLHGRFATATFFTSQFEFSNAGELQLFVDDKQLESLNREMTTGVLGSEKMSGSFNMLRASDLIWGFVVNNYLLGKEPFPFDLLYWNSDSTRMPARVHSFYLKRFYRDDALAKGEMELGGTPLDLGAVDTPSYHVAAREDHIAPVASVYRGVRLLGGERRFVIAGSGHIAGVVNPPESGKYQHWVRSDGGYPDAVETWLDGAAELPGSWWGDWATWLRAHDPAPQVAARKPARNHEALEPAPGSYVRVRD